ncbi:MULTISPECIES: hypothetical protein [unclassified Ruegeria]|uniref:hypothetical protein n=1 Tax=unclassified Ruegeria TaxID=2625375 RepID=UPI0014889C6B|nr:MULTISPECIES: hypothetical protein [unclassified Ruegeria]
MSNSKYEGHLQLDLMRLRENLSAAYCEVLTAGTSGAAYVLQQPSGAVYTDRPGAWTFDLSSARGFQAKSNHILGAEIVPFEHARRVMKTKLRTQLSQIDGLLGITKDAPNGRV